MPEISHQFGCHHHKRRNFFNKRAGNESRNDKSDQISHVGFINLEAVAVCDLDDWLDKVGWLVLHEEEGFLDLLKTLEPVGDELLWVDLAEPDEAGKLLHPEAAARSETGVDVLVAHADAPLDTWDADGFALTEVVDVTDDTTWPEHLDGLSEGVAVTTSDDNTVDALAVGELENLVNDWAVPVVDDIGGTILPGDVAAVLPGADSDDAAGTHERAAGDGHETDWADTDDDDGITDLDLGELSTVEAGGHHVAKHDSLDWGDALWKAGEVSISLVDVEVLGEDTVLVVGELPASEHAARVHWEASLGGLVTPVWGDSRDDDLVTNLDVLDKFTNLDNLTDGLVTKDHVVAVADGASPDGVGVGCARGEGEWADDGIKWAASWDWLLDPADLSNAEHGETLHLLWNLERHHKLKVK